VEGRLRREGPEERKEVSRHVKMGVLVGTRTVREAAFLIKPKNEK
jgi:hypothetical protein